MREGGIDNSTSDDVVPRGAESGVANGLSEGAKYTVSFASGHTIQERVMSDSDGLQVFVPTGPCSGMGVICLLRDSFEAAGLGLSEVSQETISVGRGKI